MPASKAILVTRPRHDVTTDYLSAWSTEVVKLARAKGHQVYDLVGAKATRKNFESYVQARRPEFLFLNGHGNADTITGHENEPILDTSSKIPATVIYARSCDAGQTLGPHLTRDSGTVFIGYRRKFMFGYLADHIMRPIKDPLAKLFLTASNLIASTLLKGHTVEEAHERSKNAMYRNFRDMVFSTASYEERIAARWMWGNFQSQVLLGNPKQKL